MGLNYQESTICTYVNRIGHESTLENLVCLSKTIFNTYLKQKHMQFNRVYIAWQNYETVTSFSTLFT